MSHGLVPSKSTVYISNFPFDLKNNDLHKVFEKHGKIVKVTIVKDRHTRKSTGVAFILFLKPEDALVCVQETNLKEMFGRTLKASIAKDNGRCAEFIKRKEYPDKTRCYECGETGHLSYKCSRNLLGERDPPPKKVRKRNKKMHELTEEEKQYFDSSDEEEPKEGKVQPDEESLSAVIKIEQEKHELEEYRFKVATGSYDTSDELPKKRIKKSAYFSDEEESD